MLNCQRFLLLTIRTAPNVEVAGILYTEREQGTDAPLQTTPVHGVAHLCAIGWVLGIL
jgi:hypothetical protein